MIIRQGDVLLKQVRMRSLKTAKLVPAVDGWVILALGEVTGHAHVLDAALAELFKEEDGRLYLLASKGAILRHEEHGAIAVPPGLHEVVRQREYSPGSIRRVSD